MLPPTFILVGLPCCHNCCTRSFAIELVEQYAVALFSTFFFGIIERLPDTVYLCVQFYERAYWRVFRQMFYEIPRPLVCVESAASGSVRHRYTLWSAEDRVLVGCMIVQFGYANTFSHFPCFTDYCLPTCSTAYLSSSFSPDAPFQRSHPWHDI